MACPHRPAFDLFREKDVCVRCGARISPKDFAFVRRRAKAFSAYQAIVGLMAAAFVYLRMTGADAPDAGNLTAFALALLCLVEPALFYLKAWLYVNRTEFVEDTLQKLDGGGR